MNLHTPTVRVPASLGRLLIAQSLPRFIVMHAGLRVEMRAASSIGERPAPDADAAVCIGPIADSDLIVQQIGVVHSITCASPELIERHGSPDSPADLAPTSCIALLDSHTQRAQEWRFRRGRAAYSISPAAHVAFGDSECAVAAAVRGAGYVRVLSLEAERQIAAGLLQPVLEDWNEECLPVVIVHSRDRRATDGIAAFGAFVAGLFPTSTAQRNRKECDCHENSSHMKKPGKSHEAFLRVQYLRFLGRIHDPLKQWKLSPMDLESRRRWEGYTRAKEVMLQRSHIPEARWWVVQAVDKKRVRLNCIDHLLKQFPYQDVQRSAVVLPTRERHEHYSR